MKTNGKLDNVIYSYATDVSYLEEENRILKDTVENLKNEVNKFKNPPLMVCELKDLMKDDKAIIRIPNGNTFLVKISNDAKDLAIGDFVLCEQKNLTVLEKIPSSKSFDVEKFVIIEKPEVKWADIGGLETQAEEIKEVIELPITKPQLFKKIGITPPKGILLHGPPGTGKTLLAKAVASSTNSTFIQVTGSELVQKFIGEGAKLVKEMFQLAREKAPAIIFIDEMDAIAAVRVDIGTSGEREVQRTFMQLLSEIDGFKALGNVKVIGCTNRKDILDPAITRPGRLDRMIHIDNPNKDARKEIFKIHTQKMKLAKKIDSDIIIEKMEKFSGAEIKAVCTEAGYVAIRNSRVQINQEDLLYAIEKIKEEDKFESDDHIKMFG